MFHCRSISHHRAPLALREHLSLTAAQQTEWLTEHRGKQVVILATCNRLELYAHLPTADEMDALWADLLQQRRVAAADVADCTVTLSGRGAARHLFRVGCGLESMALGEPQILGQVTRAYEQALACQAVDAELSLLFRAAIHAAKRARAETAIGAGAASVSSLAITRAEQVSGPLTERAIGILGAGEMADTLVKALLQRRVQQITLVSRTFANARNLAERWGVHARPITELHHMLSAADVLFTTSNAPFTLLAAEDIAPIMRDRPGRPLCIVDVAVPRDVDPSVASVPGVQLYDLDDLQHVVEETLEERRSNVPLVEDIIEQELALFWADYQARAVAPTIQLLRQRAEQLRQHELAWAYNRLPAHSEQERALLEQFSHRLMNKMLHQLTRNLKARAAQEDSAWIAAMARDLFGLGDLNQ